MTDVVISGDTVVRKAPPPPASVEVQMEPPTVGPEQLPSKEDIRLKNIGGTPLALSEDGTELREAMRGREVPLDAHVTTDGYHQKGSIVEWKAGALPEAGEHESHAKQIQRASASMREARTAAWEEAYSKF